MGNNNSVPDISIVGGNQNRAIQSNRNATSLQNDINIHEYEVVSEDAILSTDAEAASSDSVTIFDTILHLPDELNNLRMLNDLSEEVFHERQRIIDKLRVLADYLEKTHTDVLIADRVGTGVGIGSGLIIIGGLIAAPFTAGLSLGLTAAGVTTGVLSGITSAGANITGYFLSKEKLGFFKEELGVHLLNLEKLSSSDSKYLVRATRFRPTIEMLSKLTEQGWAVLLTTFQKLSTHALNGDYAQINRLIDHVADPEIIYLIKKLPLPLNPESLHALAEICTFMLTHLRSIRDSVKAFLNYFKRPEIAKLAMIYTSSSVTAKMASTAAATATENGTKQVISAFKGTPMAMTRAVRAVTGALIATFIVIDVIHMVQICKETGKTPTVLELRKMADDLEEEIKFTSTEMEDTKDSQERETAQVINAFEEMKLNSQGTEDTQNLNDVQFFDCNE